MTTTLPLFSVITVTYNAENTLERTIKSVLSQSFSAVEYIIIDGKSKDNTMQIVDRYKSDISIVVSEKDKGIYDAMNKGIEKSTGRYLCFMNAGDMFCDNHVLERLSEKIKNEEPDVIYGDTAIVDIEGKHLHMRRLSMKHGLNFNSFRRGMLVCHQSFIAKRELVSRYDTQYRFSADYDWCLNILKKSKKNTYSEMTITKYLSEGVTTKNRWKSLKERYRIMCKHYGVASTIAHHIYIAIRLPMQKIKHILSLYINSSK